MRRFTHEEKLSWIQRAVAERSTDEPLVDWCIQTRGAPSSGAIYGWCAKIFGKSFPYVTKEDFGETVTQQNDRPVADRARSLVGASENGHGVLRAEIEKLTAAVKRRDEMIVDLLAELEG